MWYNLGRRNTKDSPKKEKENTMFKNKKLKRFALGFLVVAMSLSTVSFAASKVFNKNLTATFGRIKLNYKGEDVTQEVENKYDTPAFTVNNRAYVPVRSLAEVMGIDVSYNHDTDVATFSDELKSPKGKFEQVPVGIEIANLGTSHAQHALIYDGLGVESFSFAMPAQRLYYDQKLLEKYIAHFKEDASLIIPISYLSFYLGYENDNFRQFNKNYYDILDFKDLKNVGKEEYRKHKRLVQENPEEGRQDYIKTDRMDYTISEGEMIADGKESANRHLEFIEEGRENKEEFVEILDDIILLALENNINPVVTTTPFTKYYNQHFSNEFYNGFTSTINALVGKYPGVDYLDYSHDKRFTNSPEYFFDSAHLNITGGKAFTKIIMEDIKKSKK